MTFGNRKHMVQVGPLRTPELVDDPEERIAALEFQIKCAKDEIAVRKTRIQELNRRVREEEQLIEKAEEEWSVELVDELHELEESKYLLVDELADVEIDLENRIVEVQMLERKLFELAREYANSIEQGSTEGRKRIELKAKIELELGNGPNMEYWMTDVRDLQEELELSVPDAREVIQCLQDVNEDFNDQSQQLESNHICLEDEVQMLRAQQAYFRKIEVENKNLSVQVGKLRNELQRRSEDVHQLERRCVALTQASQSDDGVNDELLHHIMHTSNQKLLDQLSEYDNETSVMESEVEDIKRQILDLELEDDLSRAREFNEPHLTQVLNSAEEAHHGSQFLELKPRALESELAKELALASEDLTVFLRSVEQNGSESKQPSDIPAEGLVSNSKLTSPFGIKENDKRNLDEETHTYSDDCKQCPWNALHRKGSEKLVQNDEILELERDFKRLSHERQRKIEEMRVSCLERLLQVHGSPRSVIHTVGMNTSTSRSSGTASGSSETRAKYTQALGKLTTQNGKLQIDLEETNHRISLISKEIFKRFQQHGDTSYLAKYALLINKISNRNDQIQEELNAARIQVISLQNEQSESALLDRFKTLDELDKQQKNIHAELVMFTHKVNALQKEVHEFSSTSLDCPRNGRWKEPSGVPSRRMIVSSVCNNNVRLITPRSDPDGSTAVTETCDGTRFSV